VDNFEIISKNEIDEDSEATFIVVSQNLLIFCHTYEDLYISKDIFEFPCKQILKTITLIGKDIMTVFLLCLTKKGIDLISANFSLKE